MKKMVVAGVLLLFLTMTVAVPVFAGNPPDHKPGSINNPGLWQALSIIPGNGYSYFAQAVVMWLLYVGTPPNWWK
jgi:hypothetical protein